jgi:hypothetical protein
MTTELLDQILERLHAADPGKQQEIARDVERATADMPWVPNPGPQSDAYRCEADELFYGGQAGGGKTDLGLGLALTAHRRSLILRRINKDAVKLVDRVADILGHRDGYNGQQQQWKLGRRMIEFAGCEHEDDKQRFKGDPHDLIYFDEGTDFVFAQYRFIIGWNRAALPNQRCRVVMGSNPPTTAEGLWVIKHWAPWLDPLHRRPARAGELRWFTTGPDGQDIEVDGRGPHLVGGEEVWARSRSYLPARLCDNPDLAETGYGAVLAGLPPELRAAYRDGNFSVGLKDHEFQVIPTAWIEVAQNRWRENGGLRQPMTAIGVDVAQGGPARSVVAPRYGGWYATLVRKRGEETRDGAEVAKMVIGCRSNNCPVIVDVGGGYGAETVGALERNGIPTVAYNGNNPSVATSRDGSLKFFNKRAESWWRFREELDPTQEFGSAVALPPGPSVKADLAAPRFTVTPRGIKIESKQDIIKRLGHSPDDGDAIVMCMAEGSRAAAKQMNAFERANRPQFAEMGYSEMKARWRG